jgi:hypothetical protein
MIINFFVWSPLISFLAINLLFPLGHHYRGNYISRFYAAIFAFPALISSIYLVILISNGSIIISKTIHLPLVPLFITIQISWFVASIFVSMCLSILLLIFFADNDNSAQIIFLDIYSTNPHIHIS